MTQELDNGVESILVARNPRGMAQVRAALTPGYYRRAAAILRDAKQVIIGTGFPVAGTFETDGPVGAIALYTALEKLGARCWLACSTPLAAALAEDYRVLELHATSAAAAAAEARERLETLRPDAVVSIERPGRAADGSYYNMRGEDISAACGIFDEYLELASCPTIAIGDGGNEIGMGKAAEAVAKLNITAAAVSCDELLVADVSNWGAYGILAYLAVWSGENLLADVNPRGLLAYLSERGSVDGVSRKNTHTEDGMDAAIGEDVLRQLCELTGFTTAQTKHKEARQ